MVVKELFGFIAPISPALAKYGILGLFLNAFLSSVIPIPTEFIVSALLAIGDSKTLIFAVLLAGSIAGTYLGYYIGYSGSNLFRRFYRKSYEAKHEKAYALINKYGIWILFASPWIPLVSDIVPIVAGSKRYNLTKFTIAMIGGKALKVFAIVYFLSFLISTL